MVGEVLFRVILMCSRERKEKENNRLCFQHLLSLDKISVTLHDLNMRKFNSREVK